MRIEYRNDPDGTVSVTVETEDMVPGMEAEPWIQAWQRVVNHLPVLSPLRGTGPT